MSFWTAIVLIVIIGCVTSVLQERYKGKRGVTTDWMGNERISAPVENPAEKAAREREIADLRERVKVLERIITEDRDTKRLSAEIDSLRDG